ncbi:MarR family transcriptional regulator [Nocardioides guangzhouensis]|uniref:MarR family transcriptional regulator n=1 Tax=Nocardioides guangzhouensis TaxID=2497878 RepID=A0A4Q4Z6K3_9ACTN|nr:MarR family transcriptional regulator [Nocardioides guangzhouensis]RYP82985.1 MarR family transcriptional regulator [Nocardioides guangzhouensis]
MDTDELVEAFLEASRALVAVAVRSIATAPVEVTLPQWRVLVLLSSLGQQTVGELAVELGVNSSNATRVCDRLEQLGLVRRRRSSADRRIVRVALTAEGTRVVEAVVSRRREDVRDVVERMSDLDAARAARALEAFAAVALEPADRRTAQG